MRSKSSNGIPHKAEIGRRGRPPRLLLAATADRHELLRLLASQGLALTHARRLRVVLLSLEGLPAATIAREVGMSRFHVSRVRRRFERAGLAGLADRPRPGRAGSASPDQLRRMLAALAAPPPRGVARWTLSSLAEEVGLTRSVVYRLLRARGLRLGLAPRDKNA